MAVAEGAALFARMCASCHGADGRGAGGRGPAIDGELSGESDDELRRLFARGEDDMPPIPMSDAEFAALLAYIRGTFGPYRED
jgi:mono/diheme cytochrome c family protein